MDKDRTTMVIRTRDRVSIHTTQKQSNVCPDNEFKTPETVIGYNRDYPLMVSLLSGRVGYCNPKSDLCPFNEIDTIKDNSKSYLGEGFNTICATEKWYHYWTTPYGNHNLKTL